MQDSLPGTRLALNIDMPEASPNSAAIASAKDVNPPSSGASDPASGPGLPAKRTARNKNLVYAVIALALTVVGLRYWLRAGWPSGADTRSEVESTLALDSFVVNLDGGGQRAYLHVGITLGVSRALPQKKEDVPVAALRDAVLSVLSSARPDQLLASDGKQKLKADLLPALQGRAPDLGIESIYFTEFLVQM
jgi:flagellar FliL protein